MQLSSLLKNLDIIKLEGNKNLDITNIVYHSKKVKKNSLFVCISGFKEDGHNYIDEAINRGATCIVLQKDRQLPHNITKILVKNTRSALSRLSSNFFSEPSKKMKLIGVTGTNGKTTITYLVESIYRCASYNTALFGTIRNKIKDRIISTKLTTLESRDLQQLLRRALDNGVEVCCMEVSSHALKLNRVDDCEFDYSIFTNLTREHLDFHKTMKDYFESKLKLFRDLTKGCSIINFDDSYGKKIVSIVNTKILKYGLNEKNLDIKGEIININSSSTEFIAYTPNGNVKINLKLLGSFNVYNALGALSCALCDNIPLETIKEGLERVRAIPGRLQLVRNNKGITCCVDYAHTPDGLRNILTNINKIKKGRLILVFGCGGDRDKSKRSLMGRIAYELADYFIITSDNPRTEDPMEIINQIKEGIPHPISTSHYSSYGWRGKEVQVLPRVSQSHTTPRFSSPSSKNKYEVEIDRYKAIEKAIKKAKKGDFVVICGKGHERYQIFKDRVIHFDDREVARRILRELSG